MLNSLDAMATENEKHEMSNRRHLHADEVCLIRLQCYIKYAIFKVSISTSDVMLLCLNEDNSNTKYLNKFKTKIQELILIN